MILCDMISRFRSKAAILYAKPSGNVDTIGKGSG